MSNESEGNYVNTEVDIPLLTDRLYEKSASFATTPLFRKMKRQGFPGVMAYPFENPDATYPSCNSSKQYLEERSIAPPSLKQRVKSCLEVAHRHETQAKALHSEGEGTQEARQEGGTADGGKVGEKGGDTEGGRAAEVDTRGLAEGSVIQPD